MAAPRPIAPAMIGVPPSNFQGSSFHVDSYKSNEINHFATELDWLHVVQANPFCHKVRRFLSVRTSYGRKTRKKSQSKLLEHRLSYAEQLCAPSTTITAPCACAISAISLIGFIVPSTFDTYIIETIFVRSVTISRTLSSDNVPSGSRSNIFQHCTFCLRKLAAKE